MQSDENASRRTPAVRPLTLRERILIAALLVVFFVLHVLALSVLQGADAGRPVSGQDIRWQLYD